MSPKINYSLYLVAGSKFCTCGKIERVVLSAVKGGVTIVQLREKNMPACKLIELGARLKKILKPLGVPLIINDRADVALACGADGVHLGQSDISPKIARKILGKKAIIGLSVENISQARRAAKEDIDYIAASPVFPTETKTGFSRCWGLKGIKRLKSLVNRPVVAIGGINASNAGAVISAGADGVAVVSAICSAKNPRLAAQEIIRAIKKKCR
ncbi:MAG: thiamine phosphate synthase [Elusimicrobia bacterium]|nr:thiamine phosphate synthase [Elusimicrobiota bacterium]